MGDKKLAHSAQMFHYQHQKQQIIAMENRNAELNHDEENDSDDNENDFTVYGENFEGIFRVQGLKKHSVEHKHTLWLFLC